MGNGIHQWYSLLRYFANTKKQVMPSHQHRAYAE